MIPTRSVYVKRFFGVLVDLRLRREHWTEPRGSKHRRWISLSTAVPHGRPTSPTASNRWANGHRIERGEDIAMSNICRGENYVCVCRESSHGGGKSAHGGEKSFYRKTRGHEIENKTRTSNEGRIYNSISMLVLILTRGGLSSGSTRTLPLCTLPESQSQPRDPQLSQPHPQCRKTTTTTWSRRMEIRMQ